MGKLLLAGAVTVALSSVGGAQAAGLPSDASGPINWTGFYAGLNAGYAWGNDTVSLDEFSPGGHSSSFAAVNAAGTNTFSMGGFTGGGQAGYNYQMDHLVFGFEGDFQYVGLRGALGITSVFPSAPTIPFNVNTTVTTNWLATVRPRAGYVVNNNLLFYVTGGLAVTNDTMTQTAVLANGFTASSSSANHIGGVIGGGVEWAINNRWSAKAEYLYANFGSVKTLGAFSPSCAGCEWNDSNRLTESTGRLGVNYKFW